MRGEPLLTKPEKENIADQNMRQTQKNWFKKDKKEKKVVKIKTSRKEYSGQTFPNYHKVVGLKFDKYQKEPYDRYEAGNTIG